MKKTVFLSLFLILFSFMLQAINIPAGNVAGTWTVANSPYYIQGDITINDGSTLSIEPGTRILFGNNNSLIIHGRLVAQGTAQDSILFLPQNTASHWGCLSFYAIPETNDSSFIKYARIEGCEYAAVSVRGFSKLKISYCKITRNTNSYSYGGGCSCDSPIQIDHCLFSENYSILGGGMYVGGYSSGPWITNSVFANNYSNMGGGIAVSSTPLKMDNCLFTNNTATEGGALYFEGYIKRSNSTFNSCRFIDNKANQQGGAVSFRAGDISKFTGCLFVHNSCPLEWGSGGALFCADDVSPTFLNCTFTENSCPGFYGDGGVLYCTAMSSYWQEPSRPVFRNCILWGNSVGDVGHEVFLEDDTAIPVFDYCCIQDGWSGFGSIYPITFDPANYTNCMQLDPRLNNQFPGWYNLNSSSPCINAGTPDVSGFLLPDTDLFGMPRIADGRIDMGCYEDQGMVPLIVVTNDREVNFGTVTLGNSYVCRNIEIWNVGHTDLLISGYNFQSGGLPFSLQPDNLTCTIPPNSDHAFTVIFNPATEGTFNEVLNITNNSVNEPICSFSLTGKGTHNTPAIPANLGISWNGTSIVLSWDPVISDSNGYAFTPAGYIVLISENPDTTNHEFYYHGFTTSTTYTHWYVAQFANRMFYQVLAISNLNQNLFTTANQDFWRRNKIPWSVIKRQMR
jgi:predicted outer membrane repeat protein